MAKDGDNVHDGTQAILRIIQADIAGMKGDMADVKQRLDGLERAQHATVNLVESVAKSVTTMSLTVEAALEKVLKSQQLMGSRMNIIEGRLAAIEEHTGLVRA